MDFQFDAKTQKLCATLHEFMSGHVYPAEAVFHQQLENTWAWDSTAIAAVAAGS